MFDCFEIFNLVDVEMYIQMMDMWIDIDCDFDINVVIVMGVGKVFLVGGDFSLIENMIGNLYEIMKMWKEVKDFVYNIINCNKLIILVINGFVVGVGFVVGILVDILIVVKWVKIVDGYLCLGVVVGDVVVIIWLLLILMVKVKYYLMICKLVFGEEVECIGFVLMCVEDDEL